MAVCVLRQFYSTGFGLLWAIALSKLVSESPVSADVSRDYYVRIEKLTVELRFTFFHDYCARSPQVSSVRCRR